MARYEPTDQEIRSVEVELFEKRVINRIPAREVAKAVIRNRRTYATCDCGKHDRKADCHA